MKNLNKSVLVTGGTGLVGSHLLFSLTEMGERPGAIYRSEAKKEFVKKVFGYYSDNPDKFFDSIEWVRADIEDIESLRNAMHGSDLVYHCAADVSFDPSQKDKIINNNVRITGNIVQACLDAGVSRLCHVSSVAAIGGNREGRTINEEQKWDDFIYHSPYAISKYRSEQIVMEGIKKGLCAVIVNPSVILGPGDWDHGSSAFFSGIKKGMLFYTGGVTGYVDVRDVAGSMIRLMNSGISCERFIISSENLSFHEIFGMIAENLGARKPFIYTPRIISWPAMWIMRVLSAITGKRSPVTSDNLRSAYSMQYYDNSKIIRETGISFIPVRKSIEDTCRIYIKEARH